MDGGKCNWMMAAAPQPRSPAAPAVPASTPPAVAPSAAGGLLVLAAVPAEG